MAKVASDLQAEGEAQSASIVTQLMTLVNVSAAAPGKRKYSLIDDQDADQRSSSAKARKSRRALLNASLKATSTLSPSEAHSQQAGKRSDATKGLEDAPTFEQAFGSMGLKASLAEHLPAPSSKRFHLPWATRSRADTKVAESLMVLERGGASEERDEGNGSDTQDKATAKLTRATDSLETRLASYADLVDCCVTYANRKSWMDSVAKHLMDHIQTTRKRVIRNNEKLAHATSNGSEVDPESVRDQGFTRPKVLVLAPFRNTALEWQKVLAEHSGCPQVEQRARFEKEYTLPAGAVDKLTQPEARARYPADHIETFAGNIDDSFYAGLKLTRKTFKLFSQFYDSDFILASPLGLRLHIEKEGRADFLSSIEMLVVDQSEVMLMQNWEHVKFILSHMNKIPKESHDTDFARVRQWYLDDKSAFFRQTIVASSFVFPELLNLYSKSLLNISGKRLITKGEPPAMRSVRTGVRQVFTRFDCADAQREADLRFKTFTGKLLPTLLKSAVSASKMLIFAPSYFDFLRLEQHFRNMPDLTCASVSEYSSNRQVSRAREAFFSGRKSILLMTERFHFYKRYRIRGCQTIVFYGLPENSVFYSEVLEFPFVHAANEPDGFDDLEPSEVKVEALFCRYDLTRLQRIAGSDAHKMLSEDKAVWKWT